MRRAALMVAVLLAGVACSNGGDSPAVETSSTTTSTAPAASTTTTAAGEDVQAYCLSRLKELAVKYPKSLGGSDLAAECRKMIDQTGATSKKTVDALLQTAETYYKTFG